MSTTKIGNDLLTQIRNMTYKSNYIKTTMRPSIGLLTYIMKTESESPMKLPWDFPTIRPAQQLVVQNHQR